MRAMALTSFGGLDGIVEQQLPVPVPEAGEVLIRVHTVGANHQDVFTMTGRAQRGGTSLPHVMGIDPSGVVAAIGEAVSGLAVNDRVTVKPPISCGECDNCRSGMDDSCPLLRNVGVHRHGGHAEYVTVPQRSVFAIGDTLDFAAATAVAHSFPVALQMLERVDLAPDDVVLVTGASGAIGSATVQLAKRAGAFVIGAAGSADRARYVAGLGADATIDYGATPQFGRHLRALVPDGVTVYVEPASDPQIWAEALTTLRPRGRVVVCGSHGGPVVELDNNWLFRTRASIHGSSGSTQRGMRHILDLAAAGGIVPSIDSIRPWEEIRDAYRRLLSRENRGKIVLRVVAEGPGEGGPGTA
jgi:NADPH:quinone reductase-like Zn-dependent oxidoreductase